MHKIQRVTDTNLDSNSHPTPGVKSCRQCRLRSGAIQVVPGEGSTTAPIVLIGESPGPSEDRSGRPFIGPAGKLLDTTLAAFNLSRDDFYITNACKCFANTSGKIRAPKPDEIVACSPWLRMEIHRVNPRFIVAMGNASLAALFGSGSKSKYQVPTGKLLKSGKPATAAMTISQARRRDDLLYGELPVLACLHPAAALRGGAAMPRFLTDIRRIAEKLGRLSVMQQSHTYILFDGGAGGQPLHGTSLKGFDFSATALDTEFDEDDSLFCYSFSDRPHTGYVVLWSDPWAERLLMGIIEGSKKLIFHSAQADVPVLCANIGLSLRNFPWDKIHDVRVMGYVNGYRDLSLKSMAENLLGRHVVRLEEIMEPGATLADIDRDDLTTYSCQDADLTISLYQALKEKLIAQSEEDPGAIPSVFPEQRG